METFQPDSTVEAERIKLELMYARNDAQEMVDKLDATEQRFLEKMEECERKGNYEDAMFYLEMITFLRQAKEMGQKYTDLIEMQSAVMDVLNMVQTANNAFALVTQSIQNMDARSITRNIRRFGRIIAKMRGQMQMLSKAMRRMFRGNRRRGGVTREDFERRRAEALGTGASAGGSAPAAGEDAAPSAPSTSGGSDGTGISEF